MYCTHSGLGCHTLLISQHVLPHVVRLLQFDGPDESHFRVDPEPEDGGVRVHVIQVHVHLLTSTQGDLLLLLSENTQENISTLSVLQYSQHSHILVTLNCPHTYKFGC